MNCPNCETENNIGYKFCIKCGQSLNNTQPVEPQPMQNENITQELNTQNINSVPVQTQTNTNTLNNTGTNTKISVKEYFLIILKYILKPFKAQQEELNKLNGLKNSAILSLIVSGVGTLINLITTMLNSVMVKSYDWSSGGYKTTWVWENLKEIKYLEVVGKNCLIYLGVIVAIAVVYYIVSLIAKKQTNFSRLLGISAIAVAPMLVCSLVLSPLLSLIWTELTMLIILVGAVYTIVLLYEGMNNEVLVEGNAKYYFNLVCLSILGIVAYYLYMKLFMSSISGGLEDIMNLFG